MILLGHGPVPVLHIFWEDQMRNMLTMLLLMCLYFPLVACADTFSLAELKEAYDGQRWQRDYWTVRQENVHVDVEIALPDASSIHVLEAAYMQEGYDTSSVREGETIANSLPGSFTCTWPGTASRKAMQKQAQKMGLHEVYAEPAPLVLHFGRFDLNTAYSVNQPMTVQDAWDQMQETANRFFLGEDIQLMPHLVHAHVNPGRYKLTNSGDAALVQEIPDFKGVLFVEFDQCIGGVPVLDPDMGGSLSGWGIFRSLADYGVDTCDYHMAFQLLSDFREEERDVRLCDPGIVIHAAEQLIQEGKLRSVYCLRLGYVAISERRGQAKLKPAWIIEGELFEKAESAPKNHRTILSVGSQEETKIVFDAQTGELMETRRMSYQ